MLLVFMAVVEVALRLALGAMLRGPTLPYASVIGILAPALYDDNRYFI